MKRIFYYFLVIVVFVACEDVIDVETPSDSPRLIVDAMIRIDTSQETTPVAIRVTTTTSFFEDPLPAKLNQIYLSVDGDTAIHLFELEPGSGIYQPSNDEVEATEIVTQYLVNSEEILLAISHQGQNYLAFTKYVPAVPITSLEQGEGTLFSGDVTEVIVTFTDNPNQDNYYLFDLDFGEFLVTEDTFFNGQEFQFSYFYDGELSPNQEIQISLIGVDAAFYNYMDQIIVQSSGGQGPFETPVAAVRGNIINVTEIDNIDFYDNVNQPNNFALGYFAVVQTFSDRITIQ